MPCSLCLCRSWSSASCSACRTRTARTSGAGRTMPPICAMGREILRMPMPLSVSEHPTGPGGLPRYANADIELGGATIAAGELVLLDLQDANLDSATFPSPEVFDVERVDNPHLTFGYGAHYCIGAPLARVELQAVLGTLFRRFPTLRLAVSVEELRPRSQLL